MFEKTLTDIVKGIRASKRDTGLYISQCLAEIKSELSSQDMYTKANALQKLTFLQMMGYSMSIASFCTIEVMSSAKFAHKRIGYLAAIQGFNSETDVILLTTNLLQKELRAAQGNTGMKGVYEAALAVNCVSNIVTTDLARDLLPELSALLSHPQPHLRKKAILCLFKVFLRYPQGLKLTFSKIQKCLDDPDAAVVSSAVNVVAELSITNPKNYLPLAPAFFKFLSLSSNNWMLIKVVKLLGGLVPEEPRLARKLLEPLADIVRKTKAKSLLYEACYTITLCLPYCGKSDGSMPANVPGIVELCASTLRSFVAEKDQNLKYLGLVGFGSLLQSQPSVISHTKYRDLILQCLSDADVTIRSRALSLLPGLASRQNWYELMGQLLPHVPFARGTYKQELCQQILTVCRSEKYGLVTDFEWYLDSVLMELSRLRGLESQADLLEQQLLDVVLRVLSLRPFAVRRCIDILLDEHRPEDEACTTLRKHVFPQVLGSAGWIIGEYSDLIKDTSKDDNGQEMEFFFDDSSCGTYHAVLQAFLVQSNIELPFKTQSLYVQSSLKVFAAATADPSVTDKELEACCSILQRRLPLFAQSTSVDVVDRAYAGMQLLGTLGLGGDNTLTNGADSKRTHEGDLLNLAGASNRPMASPARNGTSLATKARQPSAKLNELLKPSPMKPAGAKAQRKHSESLKLTPDVSCLGDLVNQEASYQSESGISMASVSFTQQKLVPAEAPTQIMEGISSESMSPTARAGSSLNSGTFQSTVPSSQTTSTTILANDESRKGDPFYLESKPGSGDGNSNPSNKFGVIQLGNDNDDGLRKKKKSKKNKRQPKVDSMDPFSSFVDVSGATADQESGILESDDDDEDDYAANSKPSNKGLANGLAKIDLTSPLDHTEILPNRSHHKVAERSNATAETKAKTKKSKKAKKDKRKKAEAPMGDLLDMTFGSSPTKVTPAPLRAATIGAVSSISPINSAFDDLLGLSNGTQGNGTLTTDPVSVVESGPWMKASIKGAEVLNLLVAYRVLRDKKVEFGARIIFQARNLKSAPIDNVTLDIAALGSVQLGSLGPEASKESETFNLAFPDPNKSVTLKGTISSSNGNASVKLSLSVSIFLEPEQISLEELAQELSSPQWFSHSAKISFVSGTLPATIKDCLSSFLNTTEIQGGSRGDVLTFACRSSTGMKVRLMAKIKSDSVKVDVKSTNESFGSFLASDIKRLQL